MNINVNTRIKVLLDVDRDNVIDSLVKINSNFSKLRNPILRNLLARRVTIAEACKIAGCDPNDFLERMRVIGFKIGDEMTVPTLERESDMDFNRRAKVYEFDARLYLERNQDPLKEILKLAGQLELGERMKIINSFEPIPLIHLLVDKGFLYFTENLNEQLFITWFEKARKDNSPNTEVKDRDSSVQKEVFIRVFSRFSAEKIKYIDVRKLEVPGPMLEILAQIESLNADEALYVYHKKVPVYLLPEIEKKGMRFFLNHKSHDEIDMLICKL